MTKKQLYIVVGIIVIVALGFLLASFLISKQGSTTSSTEKTNIFANFSPFGKSKTNGTGTNGTGSATNNETDPLNPLPNKADLPLFRQVTDKPTAGVFSYSKLGKTYVEYAEKETGNIYEMNLEDMRPSRLSNSLITRVTEAFFGNGGKMVVLRYLKNGSDVITSFVLDLSKTTREGSTETEGYNSTTTRTIDPSLPTGKFLPSGIMNALVSVDSKKMFYLTRTQNFEERIAAGSVFDFEKNTSSDVFLSPFSEWIPVFYNGVDTLLQTKASQNVPGFLYSFNIKTGDMQKIIGDIPGLTALPSPDKQRILYSKSTRGGVTLHSYNKKDSVTVDMPLYTLSEKCVWKNDNITVYCAVPDPLPSGQYPDSWYQGIISFSDNLWKINTTNGNVAALINPTTFGQKPMDMTNLTLSPTEDFIFFINKKNSSLWAFDLTRGEI